MTRIPINMKSATRPFLVAMILLLNLGTFTALTDENHDCGDPSPRHHVKPWSFGVMGDTQWTLGVPGAPVDPEGTNRDFVSVSVARQIQDQFIKHGVKFVIQLGDLTNWGGDAGIATRALAAEDLYKKKIGFFPMRGNHETYGSFFGLDPDGTFSIPAFQSDFPQTRGLTNTFGAQNFSSPTAVSTDLDGMSYSFDFGPPDSSARFVILDPLATKSKLTVDPVTYLYYGYPFGAQQQWISSRLDKNTRGTTHAFVFSHQPLMAETHADSPFGGLTDYDIAGQKAFFASLQNNDVKYYISAHDHVYQRSIVASPDQTSKVEELIATPACPKFYAPISLTDAKWNGQKTRETSLSQELGSIGFYIYTVDGPQVTVDYYSDEDDHFKSDTSWPNSSDPSFTPNVTPKFNFALKESWGYSLNGKEFLVAENAPYTSVADAFSGTAARILSGLNNSAAVDGNGRKFIKKVTTGWTPDTSHSLISDILTLWGMANFGTEQTESYTLSLTYNYAKSIPALGNAGIATLDARGNWVNAVDMNYGGTKKFVKGPWKTGYGLGTYGIDPSTKTAWAVINYNADFAVSLNLR